MGTGLLFDMMAVSGADRMASMVEVAERVNFDIFKRSEMGACVRVGGRLSESPGNPLQLTTTDGGVLSMGGSAAMVDGFVEVVGKKTGDAAIEVIGITGLGQSVDVELWDEAVKMANLPQLREYFK